MPPASKRSTIEAVDDDTYDEAQGGFVTDTAGIFCAVVSDQYSDLYIDKSDFIPKLISDETESEDESLLDRGIHELCILPAISHTYDSKQFLFEADSAELYRYLGTIVYTTQIPDSLWNDTRVAQDSVPIN